MKKYYPENSHKEIISYIKNGLFPVKIAKMINVSYSSLKNYMYKQNIKCRELQRQFNENFFSKIDSECKAYWLGFLMADGCVYKRKNSYMLTIGLQKGDKNHLQKFHNDISSNKKIWFSKNCISSLHSSNIMCNDLIKLGCVPKKSLILKFPKINKELQHHFIRGYFDGDGCISYGYYKGSGLTARTTFVCGSYDFLYQLKKILNLPCKVFKRKNVNCYSIGVSGNKKSSLLYDYMYNGATIYLDRKKQKFDEFLNLYSKLKERRV